MLPIEVQLLLLVLIANGAPIIAAAVCKDWGAYPLDGGWALADGQRLFGATKTWRGVLLAPVITSAGAVLLELPLQIGMIVGIAAMLGDLLSSFIKRRLGMASSSMALGLDQIPEVLLPLLAVTNVFDLTWRAVGLTVASFMVLELLLSRVLFWCGLRNRPY